MGQIKFAIDLRLARRLAGLSQAALARKAGIDQSVLCKLETGVRKRPSYEVALRLADALGIQPRELFLIQDDAA